MDSFGRIGRGLGALIGLYPLAGAAALAFIYHHERPTEVGALSMMGGAMLVALASAAAFLPAARRLRLYCATRPVWARALLAVLAGAIACISIALVGLAIERAGIAIVGTEREMLLGYAALPALALIAATIFPVGLGYLGLDQAGPHGRVKGLKAHTAEVTYRARDTQTQRDGEAYRPGIFAAMETQVTYHARGDGRAPPPVDDGCRTQDQHAATNNDFIGKIQGRYGGGRAGTGPDRRHGPHAASAARGRSTPLEVLLPLLVIGPLFLGALAFRFSPTLQSPGLDAWLDRHFWIGCGLAVACFALPVLIRAIGRRPLLHTTGPAKTALAVFVGFPVLTLGSVSLGGYDAFPTAWHMLTDNPVETRAYIVREVADGRRTRGCVTLHYAEDPGRIAFNCGLDQSWAETLRPGDLLEVTGEASRFGHSFEAVALAGTAPVPDLGPTPTLTAMIPRDPAGAPTGDN